MACRRASSVIGSRQCERPEPMLKLVSGNVMTGPWSLIVSAGPGAIAPPSVIVVPEKVASVPDDPTAPDEFGLPESV